MEQQSITADYKRKVKLMCSYGGTITPRPPPHDNRLTYTGGDTKLVAVDRRIKFSDLVAKLTTICNAANHVSFNYQLPGEDLDALVSVINDDDLNHMMDTYDRMQRSLSPKPARLRLFLFASLPLKSGSHCSNPDYLFGFDEEYKYETNSTPRPEIPWAVDAFELVISGSDCKYDTNLAPRTEIPRAVDAIQPVVSGSGPGTETQGITGQALAGWQDTFQGESHVIIGGNPRRQVIYYRARVITGGYEVPGYGLFEDEMHAMMGLGIIYGRQPVYNYVQLIPNAF